MFSSRQKNVQGSAGFSYIKFWILVQADVFRPEFKRGTAYQFVRLSGFEEPNLQKSFFFSSIGQKEKKIFFPSNVSVGHSLSTGGVVPRQCHGYFTTVSYILAQRSSGDNHGTLRTPL